MKKEPRKPTVHDETSNGVDAGTENTSHTDNATIAVRAYELWEARGCPLGSPEVDWLQAEEELRSSSDTLPTAA